MSETQQIASHTAAWDAYNKTLAERSDWLNDIAEKIYDANYFAGDAVNITMDTAEWDAVYRLILMGRAHLPKPAVA